MFRILLVAAVVLVAFAAEFVPDSKSSDSIIVGIGANSPSTLVAGSANTNTGAEPEFYSNGEWKKSKSLTSGLVLDIAATKGNKVTVAATMAQVQVSVDEGSSWAPIPGVIGLTQSVENFNGDSFGVAGQFVTSRGGGFSGVGVSTDGAAGDWTLYPIDGATSVRYGEYPSASTWYVTEGMWNTNTTDAVATMHAFKKSSDGERDLSSFLKVGGGRQSHHVKNVRDSPTGWFGNIWKTSDGGNSFSKVYSTSDSDMWYFNQISCSSESHCVAVGEGQLDTGAPLTVALVTTDGGSTWTKTEFTDYASLMACKMVSEDDVWIAPLQAGRGKFQADFLHSTDGGKSFTNAQSLENCFSTFVDSDPSGALVASTCLNAAGTSTTVAFYQ